MPTIPPRRKRQPGASRRRIRVAAILLPLLLGGCSTVVTPGSAAPTTDFPPSLLDDFVRCLTDRGYEIAVGGWGDLTFVMPDEVRTALGDQLWQDYTDCRVSTGFFAAESAESESERRQLYHREVETYRCYLAEGHTPPAPPSEETFVSEVGVYSTATYMTALSEEAARELNMACPSPIMFPHRYTH